MVFAHLTPTESPMIWLALFGGFGLGFLACRALERLRRRTVTVNHRMHDGR